MKNSMKSLLLLAVFGLFSGIEARRHNNDDCNSCPKKKCCKESPCRKKSCKRCCEDKCCKSSCKKECCDVKRRRGQSFKKCSAHLDSCDKPAHCKKTCCN